MTGAKEPKINYSNKIKMEGRFKKNKNKCRGTDCKLKQSQVDMMTFSGP